MLPSVLQGIDAAISAGLTPLKLNAVVMRGVNDDELADLVAFAHGRGAEMRLIEYMPMGRARLDEHNRTVPAREMVKRLSERFDLAPPDRPARGGSIQRPRPGVGLSADGGAGRVHHVDQRPLLRDV